MPEDGRRRTSRSWRVDGTRRSYDHTSGRQPNRILPRGEFARQKIIQNFGANSLLFGYSRNSFATCARNPNHVSAATP